MICIRTVGTWRRIRRRWNNSISVWWSVAGVGNLLSRVRLT